MTQSVSHQDLANAIRFLSMDAVQQANSGHPGMPMGMADVATVLFQKFMKFNAADMSWADRDRFILSAGHGSMLLYALLYLTGEKEMTLDQVRNFRQMNSLTPGHPEYGHTAGVETTTGPLGQGIATAVGMAMAERMQQTRFGTELVDHYTYVIAGDGCLMEGISQEALSMAGHLKLGKLIVLFDDNNISIDGDTSIATSEDNLARFKAAGWAVNRVDGHDPVAIEAAIAEAKKQDQPSLIACKTVIGFGAPTKKGTAGIHGAPLGAEEIAGARDALNWPHAPFDIPENILSVWREIGSRGVAAQQDWQAKFDAASADDKQAWQEGMSKDLPARAYEVAQKLQAALCADQKAMATRKSSQVALEVLAEAMPNLIGGSADLTGSNNTKAKVQNPITPDDFSGSYIHYGVREHGMAAAMNGIALHGGFIPYGGTFMVFTDYCRGAIRLSALMNQRVIYVMTHDSIGLGEDGPTHQPVEHLASLRAMPNLNVFRPADSVEALESWMAALESKDTPSILVLSRQNLPAFRTEVSAENLSAKGGYVVQETDGGRDVTLMATGSELSLALQAAAQLKEEGIRAAVVSMVCWELFEAQEDSYRQSVLGTAPRVAIEAALPFGWSRYTGSDDNVVGMPGFGASAPAGELYQHFGITADALSAKAKAAIKQ